MSSLAVVLLHDTNVREREFGVFRLWNELKSRWPSFEFTHGHGLGILGVGAELPGQLERLFQPKGYTGVTAAIRSLYSTLGSGLRLRLDKELQVADFQSELSRRSQRISDLERELASREQGIADREQRILDLELELLRHRSEMERLTSASRADQERVAHLERKIESMKTSCSWQITAPLRWVDHSIRTGIWNNIPKSPKQE